MITDAGDTPERRTGYEHHAPTNPSFADTSRNKPASGVHPERQNSRFVYVSDGFVKERVRR